MNVLQSFLTHCKPPKSEEGCCFSKIKLILIMSCIECGSSLPDFNELLQKYCSKSCRFLAKKKRRVEKLSFFSLSTLGDKNLHNDDSQRKDGTVLPINGNFTTNDVLVVVNECIPLKAWNLKRSRSFEFSNDSLMAKKEMRTAMLVS
jgi:predicted nucleic acid-binding Zn ribbon protein